MDDDNDTTASLIEKAINKNMTNLCYNLKKIRKDINDFEFYKKKKEQESDFTSAESSLEKETSIMRKSSWSPSADDLQHNAGKPKLKQRLERSNSLKVIRGNKKYANRKRRVKSVGRLDKVNT
jgi:hypothetical protein